MGLAFFKAVWRFIMAVKDVLVLFFLLLFFAALYAILSYSPGERPAKTMQGALLLDLDGVIVEQKQEADPFAALMASEAPMQEYSLRDIVTALEAARDDDNVKAVVLDLDGFMGGGQVALARIGEALDAVRAADKPVLSYATLYDDDGYQLAAHSSGIWVNSLGGVLLAGPGGSNLYYKGLLDKLGVTAHIYRVGSYKSAVEPFMLTEQSQEAKQAARALGEALWENWQADVTKARPQAQVADYGQNPVAIIEAARGDASAASLAARLVDTIGNRQDFEAHVAQIAGRGNPDEQPGFAAIALRDYVQAKQRPNNGDIGILTVAGMIIDGEAGPGTAAGDSIAQQLHDALAEKKLKALVVRVDSPGGSVLASERIRTAILAAKAKGLPVVTSMGNVAASGGYWVATPSDRIFAEPSTVTGSIGVFGVLPSFEGALEKIGITTDGIKTTPLSGEPDLAGGISPEFNRISQLSVEYIYRRFLRYVAQARGMTPERVDEIAQGRVWAGGTARQLGLVDQFGGLEEAVAEAARLAKLDPADAKPYYIEPERDPFTQFIAQMAGGSSARVGTGPRDILAWQAAKQRALISRALGDARMLVEGGSLQALCIECSGLTNSPADGRAHGDGLGAFFARAWAEQRPR